MAEFLRRLLSRWFGPEAPQIGEDDGEPCNRDGCDGAIWHGVVSAKLTPNGHTEINGLACDKCDWFEEGYDYD